MQMNIVEIQLFMQNIVEILGEELWYIGCFLFCYVLLSDHPVILTSKWSVSHFANLVIYHYSSWNEKAVWSLQMLPIERKSKKLDKKKARDKWV